MKFFDYFFLLYIHTKDKNLSENFFSAEIKNHKIATGSLSLSLMSVEASGS
jgi:hypothetical protein